MRPRLHRADDAMRTLLGATAEGFPASVRLVLEPKAPYRFHHGSELPN